MMTEKYGEKLFPFFFSLQWDSLLSLVSGDEMQNINISLNNILPYESYSKQKKGSVDGTKEY